MNNIPKQIHAGLSKVLKGVHAKPDRLEIRPSTIPGLFKALVIWPGFQNMHPIQRQEWLWNLIEKQPHGWREYLSKIIMRTPEEQMEAEEVEHVPQSPVW